MENQNEKLDPEVVMTDAELARAEAVLDAETLAKALEAGNLDILNELDAPAAGGNDGIVDNGDISDSSGSPVIISRTGNIGDVTAGYDTTNQTRGFTEVQDVVGPIDPDEEPIFLASDETEDSIGDNEDDEDTENSPEDTDNGDEGDGDNDDDSDGDDSDGDDSGPDDDNDGDNEVDDDDDDDDSEDEDDSDDDDSGDDDSDDDNDNESDDPDDVNDKGNKGHGNNTDGQDDDNPGKGGGGPNSEPKDGEDEDEGERGNQGDDTPGVGNNDKPLNVGDVLNDDDELDDLLKSNNGKKPDEHQDNGFGNGDDNSPGNSGDNNFAENRDGGETNGMDYAPGNSAHNFVPDVDTPDLV